MNHYENQRPLLHESFDPGGRAAFMAEHIIKEIGNKTNQSSLGGQPTHEALWAPFVSPVQYRLQKFDFGSYGTKYHYEVLALDDQPIARYVIYTAGEGNWRLAQIDNENKHCTLEKGERIAMQAAVLRALTTTVPKQANEIFGRLVNKEFNAIIGRFILSDFAVEQNGAVQMISPEQALAAADGHRRDYNGIIDFYGTPESQATSFANDDEDELTTSFELAAARTATQLNHKWRNTINPNTAPSDRYRRSS